MSSHTTTLPTGTPQPPIHTVAIPTKDRPNEFRKCFNSLIKHCDIHDRRPRIIVVDGSEKNSNLKESRQLIESVKQTWADQSINYVCRDQILTLISNLSQISSVPNQIVHFCLAGMDGISSRLGASRNFISLSTQGVPTLSLDDDVLLDVYTFRNINKKQRSPITQSLVPMSFFFSSRKELLLELEPATESVFEIHERYLGRLVADCNFPPDVEKQLLVYNGHPNIPRIGATSMGVAGNLTTAEPTFEYYRSMASGACAAATNKDFQQILEAGEAIRVVEDAELSFRTLPSGHCMGLENSHLSPPWFPNFRSQDLVFHTTLSITGLGTLTCNLPWIVLHDRPGSRKFTSLFLSERSSQISVCELLSYWLHKIAAESGRDITTLTALGESLISIAANKGHTFETSVIGLLKVIKAGRLKALQSIERRCLGGPVFFQKEMQQTATLLTSNHLPLQISDIPIGLGNPMHILRDMILLFGHLMIKWQDIARAFPEACKVSGLPELIL